MLTLATPVDGVNSDQKQGDIRSKDWPILSSDALYGLPGEIIHTIEPHSEADPAALLIQFLVGFGNMVGRRSHFRVEADRHFGNLFAVLVGSTSKGRKGTSWSHIRNLLEAASEDDWSERIQTGLSSGEGLIYAVRDEVIKGDEDGEEIVTDNGVDDKRLLVVEPEFASVLRVAARDGSTLSAIVRQAWDSGELRILNKNSPLQATGAYISIIGHITRDELLRYLDRTETANGFANRFLWVCVKRSKLLPEGGSLEEASLSALAEKVRRAAKFSSGVDVPIDNDPLGVDEIRFDGDARLLWHRVYSELSEGHPGLLGAVTSRSEAYAIRLATVYALLDCSSVIQTVHLQAALAVWQYCEDSARFVFGDSVGDPIADTILKALKQSGAQGLTRTAIRDLLARNPKANQVDRALGCLAENGLARSELQREGQGRPTERWFALQT